MKAWEIPGTALCSSTQRLLPANMTCIFVFSYFQMNDPHQIWRRQFAQKLLMRLIWTMISYEFDVNVMDLFVTV